MRYIGSKISLLNEIDSFIKENIKDKPKVFLDAFSGTGCVGHFFKKDYKVIANDQLYFCYILSKVTLRNDLPNFENLKKIGINDPLEYLNTNNITINESYFITKNYSPYNVSTRMYFSVENAKRIDFIRQTISSWLERALIHEHEYEYLLCCLIQAVPNISNISGTYGAYLKHWDKRALNKIFLKHLTLINNYRENTAFNSDILKLLSNIKTDICYIDPPYNGRQYTSNYHVLETIAKYDFPEIKGVTGIRNYHKKDSSEFCKKTTVSMVFEKLIQSINSRHIIMSYSSEGLLDKETITSILKKYGKADTFNFKEIPYRKYKSKIISTKENLCEYLFYIQKDIPLIDQNKPKKYQKPIIECKKNNYEYVASPMNYIGGKYKLLPQLLPLFPKDISNFYDLFSGGGNISANITAEKIFLNDINKYVIDIIDFFYSNDTNSILHQIYKIIEEYQLSKNNLEGYKSLRLDYNLSKDPIKLYTLVCYSFNYQFRFNNNHDYNNTFGKDKSCFSKVLEQKLIKFVTKLKEKEIVFSSTSFENIFIENIADNTFVYCDPPYLITTGSYNDGKRGFKGWGEVEELELYNFLDNLNNRNIKFGLSNVIHHKGVDHQLLIEWSKKYKTHILDHTYANSSYNTSRGKSIEVLITNY